ncbi:MAG TPA: SDR family oxidoreductase [Alphaproteobacteria bacterium]|nr:SDR family oxidoreductase [Alphaproteobacteria bacterium]
MPKSTATLITGASSGIGLELAKIFAKNGHNLVLVARSENTLNELKKQLEESCAINVKVIVQDLKYYNAPTAIYDAVKADDIHVNVLINNAGFGVHGEFKDTDLEKELEMIQVNVTAVTHLTKMFLTEMLEANSGRIMNVASTAAFNPGPLMAVYYASKAYVLSFSEALAEELSNTNIKVTTLCPGPTKTNFSTVTGVENARVLNEKIPDAKEIAEYAYNALVQEKRIAIPGIKNKILINATRIIPRKIVTKTIKKIQQKKQIKKPETKLN